MQFTAHLLGWVLEVQFPLTLMMCAFCDDSCNPFIDETLGAVKIFPNAANLKAFKMGVGFSFFPVWVIAVFLITLYEQKVLSKTDIVCQKE